MSQYGNIGDGNVFGGYIYGVWHASPLLYGGVNKYQTKVPGVLLCPSRKPSK